MKKEDLSFQAQMGLRRIGIMTFDRLYTGLWGRGTYNDTQEKLNRDDLGYLLNNLHEGIPISEELRDFDKRDSICLLDSVEFNFRTLQLSSQENYDRVLLNDILFVYPIDSREKGNSTDSDKRYKIFQDKVFKLRQGHTIKGDVYQELKEGVIGLGPGERDFIPVSNSQTYLGCPDSDFQSKGIDFSYFIDSLAKKQEEFKDGLPEDFLKEIRRTFNTSLETVIINNLRTSGRI